MLILLVIWLVKDIHNNFEEPLIIIIGLIISVILGTGIVKEISDIRTRFVNLPLESLEDPSIDPWGLTNHSISEIKWNLETNIEHNKLLLDICKKQFPCGNIIWSVPGFNPIFERLLEETATLNYRILYLHDKPQFLRIHKLKNPQDLTSRINVTEYLRKETIFSDKYLDYISPLTFRKSDLNDDKETNFLNLRHTSFLSHGEVLAELFPYAEGVTHYSGNTIEELVSVAECFGNLQEILHKLPIRDKELYQELDDSSKKNPLIVRPFTAKEINEKWLDINKNLQKKPNSYDPVVNLLKQEEINKIITEWVKNAEDERAKEEKEEKKDNYFLLHDVHPHNIFCIDKKCQLIYDFSWIGNWPHSCVVAFTLHRFVREYAMDKDRKKSKSRENLIKTGSIAFIEAYRANCRLDLKDDFETNLRSYIRPLNIDKMLKSIHDYLSTDDIRQRSPARRLGEVRKFIRYMKEADEFVL